MRIFGREPALLLGVISAALSLVVTLGVGLTSVQAGAMTRPIAPAAFTGVVTAVADLLAAFHFELSAETIGALNALVLAVLTFLARGQVSPAPPREPHPVLEDVAAAKGSQ